MIVNISEAKANLSKLVNMAYHGETVVIAKNNLPLVSYCKPLRESNIRIRRHKASASDLL